MLEKIKQPISIVIFGASGDLAHLKLYPALYEMVFQKRFGADFSIIGFARTPKETADFRKGMQESIEKYIDPKIYDPKITEELLQHVHYQTGQYSDLKSFGALGAKIKMLHSEDMPEVLGYYAVPPIAYADITLGLARLREMEKCKVQIMLEKPFGSDRKSAGELFHFIGEHFEAKDIFLIDHYLGKATVQSILPLRYNNAILNLLLKGSAISNIQISALETVGVEERMGYFDQVGIIKDMVQSHLLQIASLITMSMPVKRSVQNIRREKGNILSALRFDDEKCGAVIGQYESYPTQKGVNPENHTPTFVALRAFIDLTEWYKVPIYIRAGKKTKHKHTYIVIEFKKQPYEDQKTIEANRLLIELYPHEEIQIRLINDVGAVSKERHELISEESLACMGEDCLPEYGRLMLDALLGRMESFLSIDEVLASWHFVDKLMTCFKSCKIELNIYKDGSQGPASQHELTALDGFKWYDPDSL